MCFSEKTVQDVRHGEFVTADKELPTETISMETDDVASGDNMTGLLHLSSLAVCLCS